MKKQVKKNRNNGKNWYLLGIDQKNEKVWLEEASFDCDWYWGLGYLEKRYSHSHFNNELLKSRKPFNEYYKEYFKETTFDEKEMWEIWEIMKSLYILKEYSCILHSKCSGITNNPCKNLIGNDDEYNRINKVVIPSLLDKLYEVLSGKA